MSPERINRLKLNEGGKKNQRDEVEESRRTKETEKGTRKEKSIRLTRERSDFPTEMVAALLFAAALASASASVEADREKEIFAIRINSTKAIPGISYGPTSERFTELGVTPFVFFRFFVHDVPFCAQNEPRESFLVSLDFTLENEGTTSLNFHFTNSDEAMAPGVHLSFSYSSWKDENRTIEAFFTGFNLSVSSQIRAVVDFQNRTLSYQSYPKTLVFKHFVLPPAANGSFYNGQRVSVKTNSESGVCVGFFQILEIPAGLNTAMEILGHNPLSPPVQLPRSRRNWRQRKKPISAGSYFWPFFLAAVIYGTVGIIINWYVKKTRSAQVIRELDTQVRKDVAMDSERD